MLLSVLMLAAILGVAYGAYRVLFKQDLFKDTKSTTTVVPPAPTRTPRKKKATDAEE
jgi:hypothetical protein